MEGYLPQLLKLECAYVSLSDLVKMQILIQ